MEEAQQVEDLVLPIENVDIDARVRLAGLYNDWKKLQVEGALEQIYTLLAKNNKYPMVVPVVTATDTESALRMLQILREHPFLKRLEALTAPDKRPQIREVVRKPNEQSNEGIGLAVMFGVPVSLDNPTRKNPIVNREGLFVEYTGKRVDVGRAIFQEYTLPESNTSERRNIVFRQEDKEPALQPVYEPTPERVLSAVEVIFNKMTKNTSTPKIAVPLGAQPVDRKIIQFRGRKQG